MPKYHLEVSDDYLTEIEAVDDVAAIRQMRKVAESHGGDVWLYRGPIRSGVNAIAWADSLNNWGWYDEIKE